MSDDAGDFSWLDDRPTHPDPSELVRVAMMDTATPKTLDYQVPYAVPVHTEKLIKALYALRWNQRLFLRIYVDNGCHRTQAVKRYKERTGRKLDESTVFRWMRSPEYATALNMLKTQQMGLEGIDPQAVLLKASKVLNDALTEKDVLDRAGDPTGFTEINGNTAMRAIEFLGKVNQMTKDDSGTRVTLEVVNIATRDPIDVVSEQ